MDLRGLPPPLPLERIIDGLLGDGAIPRHYLVPHEPRPLMAMLKRMGVSFAARPRDTHWEIVVGAERFGD